MQCFSKAIILNINKKAFAWDLSKVFQSFRKIVIPFPTNKSRVSDTFESPSLYLST